MNKHCQCESSGFCPRHQMDKDERKFRYCKGLANIPDCGRKYWEAWEQGRLGATVPEDPVVGQDWNCNDQIIDPVKRPSKEKLANSTTCLVGTRIKAILRDRYNITARAGCSCEKHARQMDLMGCDGCKKDIDTIVEWLKEGASERVWLKPLVALLKGTTEKQARKLVEEAIELEEERVKLVKEELDRERKKEEKRKEAVAVLIKDPGPKVQPKVIPWAYGVTTVSTRLDNLLPRTLSSLAKAGFDEPWLFIDGLKDPEILTEIVVDDRQLCTYNYTLHHPNIKTFGNWITGLWEVYIRQPLAEHYAMFQDDLVAYSNLKSYLNNCKFPGEGDDRGYWNLYTFPANQKLCNGHQGWFSSNQRGLGAVALVFSRDCVMDLLSSKAHIVERPTTPGRRAWTNIDGGIVSSLKKLGWQEYVHNPSLVQHTGEQSSMGGVVHPQAPSFRGETFDARELIKR